MKKTNYQYDDDLNVKSILKQLAFGLFMGLAFIAVVGLGELIADWLGQ